MMNAKEAKVMTEKYYEDLMAKKIAIAESKLMELEEEIKAKASSGFAGMKITKANDFFGSIDGARYAQQKLTDNGFRVTTSPYNYDLAISWMM